jgi:fructose-1,6-bisphosphatase I
MFQKISEKIRDNDPLKMGNIVSKNISDDEVKKLDILSNEYLIEELSKNKYVKTISSEENDDLINCNKDGNYFISFDPLDGSSNIDSNITIGTIFAIFKSKNIEKELLGNSIVAAGYCLYGGSTQLVYTKKMIGKPVVNLYL